MNAPAVEGPLTGAEFERLMAPFDPFEACPDIAVAVSGGRDSLALALLAHAWAAKRGGRTLGLIVDHGLRAGSAAEAEAALRTLAMLGCCGVILRWRGAKPVAGVQEAARTARYRLLLGECRRRGILHLLVAHHADDQAETVVMRMGRRSGVDGLAGMSALVEHPEARMLRPLLTVRRSRLTETLRVHGVPWVDDPSNADFRFERARLRAAGDLLPAMPCQAAERAAARRDRERALAGAATEVLEIAADGAVALDRAAFLGLSPEGQAGLVSRIVQSVGTRAHPPRRDRLQRAVARLVAPVIRGKSGRAQNFTFASCTIVLRQAPTSRRLQWIVAAENGRKESADGSRPLVPAAFFACGAAPASHLKSVPSLLERNREPLQP
ncbi:MAG: tRNA lysidine(34) synthetase TilS [Pseudomonadota bacterium]